MVDVVFIPFLYIIYIRAERSYERGVLWDAVPLEDGYTLDEMVVDIWRSSWGCF